MIMNREVYSVVALNSEVAEGPIWSVAEGCLYYLDISGELVHRFYPMKNTVEHCVLIQPISSLVLCADGKLLIFTQRGIAHLDFESGEQTPWCNNINVGEGNRFNDAKLDQHGRLWAGSMCMDLSQASGQLVSISVQKQTKLHASGFTVANGLDWSPDGKTFYLVDTYKRKIYAYDFDLELGAISNRREFVAFLDSDGKPDGICVDAQGYVWCAVWDGWSIRRYAPDGSLERKLCLPVQRPTSVAFGGGDLETLYITTARCGLSKSELYKAPWSGHLLAYSADVKGQSSPLFQVCALEKTA